MALVALLTVGLLGCPPLNGIKSVSPASQSVVTTFSFDVVVEIDPARVDGGTLVIEINGGPPIPLSGGPTVFTTTVNPGPPLLDQNVLKVTANTVGSGTAAWRISSFAYLPPKARARQIADPADLVTGPLAHGRLGDWLLENGNARFVVQDAPQRDLYSIGQFGGNLIDAERVVAGVPQGRDNFFEIQPAVNIESILHHETIEIVNDGQDGTPAVVRACGPDDLLDFVNASSEVAGLGVSIPPGTDDTDQNIEGCTTYSLAPEVDYLEMETSLTNLEPSGGTTYSNFAGDYMNGMGELELWTSSDPGFSVTSHGVGELLFTAGYRAISFFGFRSATGVDYAYVPLTIPGAPFPVSTNFTTSGVSVSLQNTSIPLVLAGFELPNLVLAPGQTKSFARRFSVGAGSPGHAVALEAEAKARDVGTLAGCVTVGGVAAPGARVAVGPIASGALSDLRSLFVTDAAGCYQGEIPIGNYGVVASLQGVPYQGGGSSPAVNLVTITTGGSTTQDIALPATGRVRVEVADENNDPVPARVTIVGFDPSPEPQLPFSLAFVNTVAGLFRDTTKDGIPYGIVWIEYANAGGVAEFDLEPGSYRLYVSRGVEYSLSSTPISVPSGPYGAVTLTVPAQIHRVLDTTGFVSGDYHVHMLASPDSRVSDRDRILSFAGEGVDNLIATDHDAIIVLATEIDALGLGSFLHSTPGEEITTFDYGHYNAYPQAQDPAKPSFGATDFGGAAPPGQDFPSLGSYSLSPAEIHDEAVNKLATAGGAQNAGLETVVQVNHIDSHFRPLKINTALTPPQSLSGPEALNFRLDPGISNFFHAFDGLELWNGAGKGDQTEFLGRRIGVWMNLLNQGIQVTAISDTDTHTFFNLETAGARTWTPTSTGSDAPAAILDNDIGLAVKAGKAIGGQGLYVQARLVDTETSAQADLSWAGSTLVSAPDGTVDLEIDVQAPTWAEYDTIEIYVNASTSVAETNGGVPVLFTSIPTQTLTRSGTDTPSTFVVNTVPAAGSQRLETQKIVPLTLPGDAWVVVIAKGTLGTSPPMFPVHPRDLKSAENPDLASLVTNTAAESGVRALGMTNALYVDVDGGGFDPPGVSCIDCP